jgi:hypothetical protein
MAAAMKVLQWLRKCTQPMTLEKWQEFEAMGMWTCEMVGEKQTSRPRNPPTLAVSRA